MESYLDNSATTKTFDSVNDIMLKVLKEDYGNPSSLHLKGVEAEKYIKEAKDIIASNMKVESKEIIFTSGGTESNNLALIGTAMANRRAGNHIITTVMEHPSIHNPLLFLEEQGYKVTYLKVDSNGHVNSDRLLEAICEETIIVSIMYVNNEIGAVQDMEGISKQIKKKKPDIIFHVDAIQAYGKYRIYPKRLGIDMMSVSGHKIHGPKGVGFLYIKDKLKIKPIIFGGQQQRSIRSGTENVAGIAGIGQAVKEIYNNMEEHVAEIYNLKKIFIEGVTKVDGVTVNAMNEVKVEDTAPHIISVSFDGIRSEVLLHALEEKGIFVSAGSACSSNHSMLSGTLKSIGIRKELLDSTLRFSLSVFTTVEEIEYTLNVLAELLPALRRFKRH